jgi:hypothetical protein
MAVKICIVDSGLREVLYAVTNFSEEYNAQAIGNHLRRLRGVVITEKTTITDYGYSGKARQV